MICAPSFEQRSCRPSISRSPGQVISRLLLAIGVLQRLSPEYTPSVSGGFVPTSKLLGLNHRVHGQLRPLLQADTFSHERRRCTVVRQTWLAAVEPVQASHRRPPGQPRADGLHTAVLHGFTPAASDRLALLPCLEPFQAIGSVLTFPPSTPDFSVRGPGQNCRLKTSPHSEANCMAVAAAPCILWCASQARQEKLRCRLA